MLEYISILFGIRISYGIILKSPIHFYHQCYLWQELPDRKNRCFFQIWNIICSISSTMLYKEYKNKREKFNEIKQSFHPIVFNLWLWRKILVKFNFSWRGTISYCSYEFNFSFISGYVILTLFLSGLVMGERVVISAFHYYKWGLGIRKI